MSEWYYGKEGQQFGPFDEATLRAKIESGEVSGDDLIWSEGMAEWTPLGKVSHFGVVDVPEVPSPPAQEYVSSDPGSPYAPPAANPLSHGGVGVQLAPPTSGLAIASMVCGILGLLFCPCGGIILGIPSVICGHMAMKQTASATLGTPPRMSGRGMAIAGLVMGYICLVMLALGLVLHLAGIALQ